MKAMRTTRSDATSIESRAWTSVRLLSFALPPSLLILLVFIGCEQRGALARATDGGADPAIAVASADVDTANWPLPPSKEPEVRVRFSVRAAGVEPFHLGVAGQPLLLLDGAVGRPWLLDGPLDVAVAGSGWAVLDGAGRRIAIEHLGPLSIRTLGGRSPRIEFEDGQLPGSIELIPRSTDPIQIDLVTRIQIEAYLPGVLEGELFGSWSLPTFQAQAIAARSYAVAEAAFWGPRRHFDLVAGPASQAWTGLEASPRALEAVESTRGMVLLHSGRVIPAYYSSCCGGRSASAHQSISDRSSHKIQPLQARVGDHGTCCEEASVRDWTLSFELGAVSNACARWGRTHGEKALSELGRLRSVDLVDSNPAGRPLRFKLVDRAGRSAVIKANDMRRLLGTVERADGGAPAQVRSDDLRLRVRDGRLHVTGSGYGHGVGLCQYGTQAMAAEGADWAAILARYYPGAEPTQVWSRN